MTHWGYGLLAAYVALGLSPVSLRKAGRLVALITLLVIGGALYSYGAI
ncbi:MAG TPA: hypothetical protein VHU61_15525 [Solirubrobacteraceae bacterium]|jgi:hypothetical protein|nr:hypothetical protein [Solirubrobacteraceae bacterium]